MNTSVLVFLSLVSIVAACPGLFGGLGGGGGGCGCGAPPPPPCGAPPPPPGCGGRKKRSIPEKKQEFFGIASEDKDALCNTPELKSIILENMQSDTSNSTKSLQIALESYEHHKYVVVCSPTTFVYTSRAETIYCGARKNDHYCHAFAL